MLFSWLRRFLSANKVKTAPPSSSKKTGSAVWTRLFLESLEDRTMLSVSASVSGTNAKFFSALVSDDVWVQTVTQTGQQQVQWSTSGSAGTWQDLGLTLGGAGTSNAFTFQMSGKVHLENFVGAGSNLTFGGIGNPSGG